ESASGLATMVGIAALANPRRAADSPKSIILDVEIYIGADHCQSLIGALRFFNKDDMDFTEEPSLYLIYTTFACLEDGIDVQPVLNTWKYKFFGDLQWVIPLAPPVDDSDDGSEPASFVIDPRHRVYIHVSGKATDCQKDAGTFNLDVEQYIFVLKDAKNHATKSESIKPFTPISCIFPDSPRFRNRKPVPYDNHFVSISGFLTDVVFTPKNGLPAVEDTGSIDHFTVTVEHIAFLGQVNSKSNSSSIIPNTLD
ncbi:hypothetical protein BDN70DRAFT_775918, partial [Pholiota conissans]